MGLTGKGISQEAQQELVVEVNPSTADLNDVVTVQIGIRNAVNLDSYDLKVIYNPFRLKLVEGSVAEGPFLQTSVDDRSFFQVDASTPGVVWLSNSLPGQDPEEAPDGDGVLATMQFKVIGGGDIPIDIESPVLFDSYRNRYVPSVTPAVLSVPRPTPAIAIDLDPETDGIQDSLTVMPGQEFQIEVVAVDVTNLDSYDFKLIYDPNYLEVVERSITEGSFFVTSADGETFLQVDLSTPGVVHLSNSMPGQDPEAAPDGTGPIVRMSFKALASGTTTLTCSDVIFFDSERIRTDVTDIRSASVRINASPMAIPETYTVNEGETLTLDASRSYDPDGTIVRYEWDLDNDGRFGDAVGITASMSFSDSGSYIVGLRVTDNDGASSTALMSITVNNVPPWNIDPNGPYRGNVGKKIEFQGSAQDVPGDMPTLVYEWDVDYDGQTFDVDLRGQNPTHAYDQPGIYTVALRVRDKDGGVSDIVTTEAIIDGFTIDLSVTPTLLRADGTSKAQLSISLFRGSEPITGATISITVDPPEAGSVGAVTDNGDGTYSATFTAALIEDELDVTITAEAPDYRVQDRETIFLDGKGPQIIEVVPGNTQAGTGEKVEVRVTATDPTEPITAKIYVNGDEYDESSVPAQFTIPVPIDSVDPINYYIVVRDRLDNETRAPEPGSYTIKVIDTIPPVAEAGPDQKVFVGQDVHFDGTGSTDNIGVVKYLWDINDDGKPDLRGPTPTLVGGYAKKGVYTVKLWVCDAANNCSDDTLTVHVIIPRFDLRLSSGLNLFSVPLNDPDITTLADLMDAMGDAVRFIVRYDVEEGRFRAYFPGDPDAATTPVRGNEGYLTSLSDAVTLKLKGTAWDGTVSIKRGINLVAMPVKPPEPMRLSEFIASFGGAIDALVWYDAEAGRFRAVTPETAGSEWDIEVRGGMGYLALANSDAEHTFEGEAWSTGEEDCAPAIAFGSPESVPILVVSGLVRGGVVEGMRVKLKNLTRYLSALAEVKNGSFAAPLIKLGAEHRAGDLIKVTVDPPEGYCAEPVIHQNTPEEVTAGMVRVELKVRPVPKRTALLQNYPNPFNPETWIPFQLAEEANVVIRIYDVNGRLIKTLNLGRLKAGYYTTRSSAAYWDGRNEYGELVSSGMYIYQLQAGGKTFTRKMVILK